MIIIISTRNMFSWSSKKNTLQPYYNAVRYNTVLDMFKDESQKCIDYIEK